MSGAGEVGRLALQTVFKWGFDEVPERMWGGAEDSPGQTLEKGLSGTSQRTGLGHLKRVSCKEKVGTFR